MDGELIFAIAAGLMLILVGGLVVHDEIRQRLQRRREQQLLAEQRREEERLIEWAAYQNRSEPLDLPNDGDEISMECFREALRGVVPECVGFTREGGFEKLKGETENGHQDAVDD